METAAPIAAAVSVPVTTDAGLIEGMNWSMASGLSLVEFLDEWRRATLDRDYLPSLGDSSRRAGERMERALVTLARTHAGGTVVAVSHGGVTVDLLRNILGDDHVRLLAPSVIDDGMPPAAVTTLIHGEQGWRVESVAVPRGVVEDE